MTHSLGISLPQLRMALGDLGRLLGWPFLVTSAAGLAVALLQPSYRVLLPLAGLLIATLVVYGNLSTYGPRYLVFCALSLSMLAGAALHAMLMRGRLLQVAAITAYVAIIGALVAAAYPLLARVTPTTAPSAPRN
jgi:hypothetical protein